MLQVSELNGIGKPFANTRKGINFAECRVKREPLFG